MPLPADFTEPYLIDYVKTEFGDGVVQVELTEPQIIQCIEDTIELFEKYRPIQKIQPLYLVKGIHQITPPTDAIGLLDVDFATQNRLDTMSVEAALLYDPFYFISSGALGGIDVQLFDLTRQWLEVVGRVLSGEFDYEMTDEGLYMFLPFAANVKLIWAMPYTDLAQVKKEYHGLFRNLVMAKSRQILGQIRSKYSGVPAAGGMLQLDGEWQRDKGAADEERYVDQLMRVSPHYIPSYG